MYIRIKFIESAMCSLPFVCISLLFSLSISPCASYQSWRTTYHKITQDPEVSEFNNLMVKNNRIAKLNLHYYDLTVFAPENQAFDDFNGEISDDLIFYHMSFNVKTLRVLNSTLVLNSTNESFPPLWITKENREIYVNNAKILEQKSDFYSNTKEDRKGKNQVMHVIDQVLDPMISTTSLQNPSAHDFITHHSSWKTKGEKLTNFLNKVIFHDQEDLFKRPGSHTFFIPVDSKIDDYKLQSIDKYVIDAHVVPNQVLFTRPTKKNFIYETSASGDYIYIVISMTEMNNKLYVKSYTVLGNSNHKKGEIFSEILVPNIPVSNGVVHLISEPLAVFDRELKPFPYLPTFYKISSDPTLNLTYFIGEQTGINSLLSNESVTYTYFAPKDKHWTKLIANGNNNKSNLRRILGGHLVLSTNRYSMQKLLLMSETTEGVVLNTVSGVIRFNVTHTEGEGYSIEWENKTIKVYRPDYECSDGIVHVLDGVFDHVGDSSERVADGEEEISFWQMMKKSVM